jgi:hypothetical protein
VVGGAPRLALQRLDHPVALTPPPPEMQALFGALPDHDEQAGRLHGVIAGSVPLAEFFAPENLAAIMAASAARLIRLRRGTGLSS